MYSMQPTHSDWLTMLHKQYAQHTYSYSLLVYLYWYISDARCHAEREPVCVIFERSCESMCERMQVKRVQLDFLLRLLLFLVLYILNDARLSEVMRTFTFYADWKYLSSIKYIIMGTYWLRKKLAVWESMTLSFSAISVTIDFPSTLPSLSSWDSMAV